MFTTPSPAATVSPVASIICASDVATNVPDQSYTTTQLTMYTTATSPATDLAHQSLPRSDDPHIRPKGEAVRHKDRSTLQASTSAVAE